MFIYSDSQYQIPYHGSYNSSNFENQTLVTPQSCFQSGHVVADTGFQFTSNIIPSGPVVGNSSFQQTSGFQDNSGFQQTSNIIPTTQTQQWEISLTQHTQPLSQQSLPTTTMNDDGFFSSFSDHEDGTLYNLPYSQNSNQMHGLPNSDGYLSFENTDMLSRVDNTTHSSVTGMNDFTGTVSSSSNNTDQEAWTETLFSFPSEVSTSYQNDMVPRYEYQASIVPQVQPLPYSQPPMDMFSQNYPTSIAAVTPSILTCSNNLSGLAAAPNLDVLGNAPPSLGFSQHGSAFLQGFPPKAENRQSLPCQNSENWFSDNLGQVVVPRQTGFAPTVSPTPSPVSHTNVSSTTVSPSNQSSFGHAVNIQFQPSVSAVTSYDTIGMNFETPRTSMERPTSSKTRRKLPNGPAKDDNVTAANFPSVASKKRSSVSFHRQSTSARSERQSDKCPIGRPKKNDPSPSAIRERADKDALLINGRLTGLSYKQIKEQGKFKEAESTLRGRHRTLTKEKGERLRNPKWERVDIELLYKAVEISYAGKEPSTTKISWKDVALYIKENGGTYHFGNATCHKMWLKLSTGEYEHDDDDDEDMEDEE